MATKWLVNRWEGFFLALESATTEAEVEAFCIAEIAAWRGRNGIKSESSLRVPLTDTRNEMKRRLQGERLEWALKHLNFAEEKWNELNGKGQAAFVARLENTPLITDPDAIVKKATELLSSKEWAEVAIGITVNTGRRLTEVLKTAEFGPKSEYSVMFSGQLKRRDRGEEEPVTFEIPTLAPAGLVLNALVRLRDGVGTDDMDNREVSRRYGPAVREAANHHFAGLVPLREGKDDLYTHLMRSIYARLAVYYYCPPRVADIHFMAMILGHSRLLDAASENEQLNYASSAHYFDYKVVDQQGAMRQGVRLGWPGVELLEVLKPKEMPVPEVAVVVQDVETEGKRKSGNRPITVLEESFNRVAALRKHLGHRTYNDTIALLLDTYERGAQVPFDQATLTPERLAPDVAPLIHESMTASNDQDFQAFLVEALQKEARFRLAMKARHADTDFSKIATSKLIDIKHTDAAKERIRRAVAAIAAHNEHSQPLERWYINATILQKLVGARFSLIAEFMGGHQAEIDAINAKYGLTPAYNRKPVSIKSVVTVPEF